MPWRHTSPLDQQRPCLADDLRPPLAIRELGALYGVSRPTGSKWLERSLQPGPLGREERSRQPHASPPYTPRPVVEAFRALRRHHPAWGAQKRLALLQTRHPRWPLPAPSPGCALLRRHGLGPKARQRRPRGHLGKPTSQLLAPTEGWSAAGTGLFKPGDGLYGDPRPGAEGYRRLRLGCQARASPRVQEAQPGCTPLCQLAGRYVSANGGLRWPHPWVNVAHVCRGSLCRPRRHR
jgi:hypothetical protein